MLLQAIDQVTLAMDFDHGADQVQVVRRLLPFIATQVPDGSAEEHDRVGDWVVDNLINIGNLDRGFQVDYGTFAPDGRYVRRPFDFKLLVELSHARQTSHMDGRSRSDVPDHNASAAWHVALNPSHATNVAENSSSVTSRG